MHRPLWHEGLCEGRTALAPPNPLHMRTFPTCRPSVFQVPCRDPSSFLRLRTNSGSAPTQAPRAVASSSRADLASVELRRRGAEER